MTAEQLSNRMRELGVPFDKTVIANLETGRRRFVTVQEAFALAYALSVAPINLLTPCEDEAADVDYEVVPAGTATVTSLWVRDWIRGVLPLPGQSERTYVAEVSAAELAMQRALIAEIISGKIKLSQEFRDSIAREYEAGRFLPVVSNNATMLTLFMTSGQRDEVTGSGAEGVLRARFEPRERDDDEPAGGDGDS